VHFKDEKGIRTKKLCPVTNFIRWRYVDSKSQDAETKKLSSFGVFADETKKMESNARLVEWEDGTKSLVIGNKHYEVQTEPVNSTYCFANFKKLDLLKG
jgi:hypothetical protein